MGSDLVGQILKQEREKQGFSIEDIANTTRIRASYIENIENDNYEDLGSTYLLGYIRTYAMFLELDAASLVKQAQGKMQAKNIEYNNPQNSHMMLEKRASLFSMFSKGSLSSNNSEKYRDIASFEQNSSNSGIKKYMMLGGIGVFVAIIAFFVFFKTESNIQDDTNYQVAELNESTDSTTLVEDNSVDTEGVEATAEEGGILDNFEEQEPQDLATDKEENKESVDLEQNTQQTENVVQQNNAKKQNLNAQTSSQVITPWPSSTGASDLRIEITSDSWVRVVNGSNKSIIYYDSVAKQGSVIQIPQTKESFMFSVGNSKGVSVFIGKRKYNFVNSSKRVVRNIPLNKEYIKNNFEYQR